MKTLIEQLPKAELHIHIEGSLEPELMFKLAQRNHQRLSFSSVEEAKQAYQFNDLQSFLNIYYQGANVLYGEEDFYDLTWNYLEKAKKQNICHTEIFFDPQTHTNRGVPFAAIITGITEALKAGKDQLGISSYLILCFLRDLTVESAFETLEQAIKYGEKIKAIGLDSAEKNNPPSKFKEVFDKARAEGFLTVAHAGEEGSSDYIWQAINLLKVSRIDHGIRCIDDPKLVEYLAEKQIPLTVCPLSNVKLKVFNCLEDHNLKILLDQGLCVTINSDDPAYFGGYLNENFLAISQALRLTEIDLQKMINNSFRASFLNTSEKEQLYIQ
ncbi:putative adenosine deaminase [Crocosphaera subtropica ATCC 51142]|uniref:Adenine deaminase n=1 Tax=Crocosphaera subtropica (strain ATCC 51142 / BH68) TaxID=43989 RepID=ADE_CROS5|nr:adenosine deaminase [Crocosphaera subtropica]B1WR40.1 RecName: Full=Adenine deaminase; Short=ADE; AltName: Full=Adenine aminohydrolase; Short=AAH [Crocosphaera subtropica ATCC 51142]ACB50098.1 putative adenosine deaminase [Crocosphaera subtropica ATCC 51142]